MKSVCPEKNGRFCMLDHGLLLIDKAIGMTSHDVVSKVRRSIGNPSVGHCGTLDPLASGLLVLLIGEATKLSQMFLEKNKTYEVTFQIGLTTDTLDSTGQIVSISHPEEISRISIDGISNAAHLLVGEFNWSIPVFSAKKINGEKMYDLARNNRLPDGEMPTKRMKFWDVSEVVALGENQFRTRVSCSSGSFIRSWVAELGKILGTGAVMTGLRRTESSPYKIENAVSLADLSSRTTEELQEKGTFVPLVNCLSGMRKVIVQGGTSNQLRNGLISYDLRGHLLSVVRPQENEDFAIISKESKQLVAIIDYKKGNGFAIRRVMNYRSP